MDKYEHFYWKAIIGTIVIAITAFIAGLTMTTMSIKSELVIPDRAIELRVSLTSPAGLSASPATPVSPTGPGSQFLGSLSEQAQKALAAARAKTSDENQVPRIAAEEFVRGIGNAAQIPKVAIEEFVKGVSGETGKTLVGFFADLAKAGFGIDTDKDNHRQVFSQVLRQELVIYSQIPDLQIRANCVNPRSISSEAIVTNALFEHDQAKLPDSEYAMLNRIRETTRRCPESVVLLSGNTDSTGSTRRNLQLAKQRVAVVRQHLIQIGGVAPDRIFSTELAAESVPVMTSSGKREPRNRAVTVEVRN